MFVLVTIISTLLAAVSASYPLADPAYLAAPVAAPVYSYSPPLVKAVASLPYATSYANTYKLSKSPYVLTPAAPLPSYPAAVVKSPIAYAPYPSYAYSSPYPYGKAYGYATYY